MERIQAIKGMNDILPAEVHWWQTVETTAREVLETFGYKEIRTPLVEKLELFARSIGESTDIVEKEMYSFPDRKGHWLTLRPEATASVVRAYIQHNLRADPLLQKFYCIGPMFRHERPQKGRYRQFHQIDAEVFGIQDPMLDAEVMYMLCCFLEKLGVQGVGLHINSLGCRECRPAFRQALTAFLGDRAEELCPDCDRRRHVNPLRVFDCKVERCRKALDGAPELVDYLCPDCRDHFQKVQACLRDLGTPFQLDPHMVRGLDYYMRTTFEVVTDRLGAQNAVGGGGRYDGLMKDLGGPDLPGIGFAIGMERLILLLQQGQSRAGRAPELFVAVIGDRAAREGFGLVQRLRNSGIRTEFTYGGGSLKSQMRRADKLGVSHVLILGDEELDRGKAPVRNMATKEQVEIPLDDALAALTRYVRGHDH
ncbi:histidyl-tRNA synthetase [Desulfacinum hydrothermale DSM 13146]|uniref:Histidine--tRNA ligase n=1 Tax=Desulfacinum hydrothermale DSM 13146 TaxID=1121390 RepID=A0A1W1X5L4_9BACT|nr:histidine--tRNA ligase [Desulfacinum hydrothermale]SMC19202.1 histidyl-tRNA synthetase [Desulfacinum hydrothermale DSM 13146]